MGIFCGPPVRGVLLHAREMYGRPGDAKPGGFINAPEPHSTSPIRSSASTTRSQNLS